MKDLEIPEGYQQVMPYLVVNDAQSFFNFMQRVFNATEKYKAMRDETKIADAELQIGKSTIMFADSTEQWKAQTAGLFVYVTDADETYKKALAEGATSIMEMSNQSYGRSGGVTDPFGNTWWITSAA